MVKSIIYITDPSFDGANKMDIEKISVMAIMPRRT